jgi:hypothetical protein
MNILETNCIYLKQTVSWRFEFEIDRLKFTEDYIRVSISFPAAHMTAHVMKIFKVELGNKIFEEYPKLKNLWSEHSWENLYFA